MRYPRTSVAPNVGQWWLAKQTSVSAANNSIDSLMYFDQPERVAHLRAPGRVEVVHRVGAVLGHAQQALVGEVEVHLGRGLGARGHLEHDPHAVDVQFGAGLGDVLGRGDERNRAQRGGLAQPGVDLTTGPGG